MTKICKFCHKEIRDDEPCNVHVSYPPNTPRQVKDPRDGTTSTVYDGWNRFISGMPEGATYSHDRCLKKELGICSNAVRP